LTVGLSGPAPAEPVKDKQDHDQLWLMVFLNLLLVMLAMFIMIYSLQQLSSKKKKPVANPFQKEQRMLAKQRTRALSLKQRLEELLRAKKLAGTVIDIHMGHVRIVLSSGVMFATGKAELNSIAKQRLQEIASVLRPMNSLIMIEGHTDDRPIHTATFPSNWELSTARALEVVRLFMGSGISPNRMKFVGFGEHRPRRPNVSEQNRRFNRRIEIKVR
jgi:chemotaxis protein MotB